MSPPSFSVNTLAEIDPYHAIENMFYLQSFLLNFKHTVEQAERKFSIMCWSLEMAVAAYQAHVDEAGWKEALELSKQEAEAAWYDYQQKCQDYRWLMDRIPVVPIQQFEQFGYYYSPPEEF